MNSRKMMLRQNIPALNIYSKSMELDDNLLDHMMEREIKNTCWNGQSLLEDTAQFLLGYKYSEMKIL